MDPISEKAREIIDAIAVPYIMDEEGLEAKMHKLIAAALRSQDSEAFTRGKIEGIEFALARHEDWDIIGNYSSFAEFLRWNISDLRQQSQKPQEKP